MKTTVFFALLLFFTGTTSFAQKSLISVGTADVEAFAGYEGLGFAPEPPAGWLDSDEFSVTGVDETAAGTDGTCPYGDTCPDVGEPANTDFSRGLSAGNADLAGGVYAFDHGAGDVGLGWQSKNNKDFSPGDVTVKYSNDTGQSVTGAVVEYDTWYLNSDTGSHLVSFSYATGSCTGVGDAYTPDSTLDVLTPGDLDIDPVWASVTQTAVIAFSADLPAGDCFFVRFTGVGVTGKANQDEVAIDNISVLVTAGAPTATFTYEQVSDTFDINFDASGSTDDVLIVSYDWDFGDGAVGTGVAPTHTYAATGDYTVVLTVTDGDGFTDTATETVTVLSSPPTAAFTYDQVEGTFDINFDASGSTDDVLIVSYDWDFGDGSVGTDAAPTHTYAAVGDYTVVLTVTDGDGQTDSVSDTVTVLSSTPTAVFTYAQVADTFDINFDASGSTDDVSIVSYDWDFGDGAVGTGVTPTHAYAAIGDYTVVLTVTDGDGLTDTDTQTVTVLSSAPTASFTYQQVEESFEILFDASGSTDDVLITTYDWDFGDGAVGTGATPSHTYAVTGDYSVVLTVSDADGQTDSVTNTVTVVSTPTPKELVSLGVANVEAFTGFEGLGFAPEPPAGWLDSDQFAVSGVDETEAGTDGACNFGSTCPDVGEPASTDFSRGLSVGNAELAGGLYAFDHGGGDVGLGWQSKSNKDFSPGDVTVKYSNETGLTVGAALVSYDVWYLNSDAGSHMVSFSSATGSCEGVGDTYTADASLDVVTPADLDVDPVWTSETKSTIVVFPLGLAPEDCFFVRFTGDGVTGDANQDEVAVDNISVTATSSPPSASFTYVQLEDSLDIVFDASGSSDDGTVVTYDWDFGDGGVGTGVNPTHTYAAAGTYTVSLTVTDDDDLTNTLTQDVLVNDPFAPYVESDGLVVMEAENYFMRFDRSDHSWVESDAVAGYSGETAMKADPDNGATFNGGSVLSAPEMTYDVEFVTTGTYYYWVRLYASSTSSNSVHGGLNGVVSAAKLNTDTIGSWVWTNVDTKGKDRTVNITVDGVATINLWVREDGAVVDKILLTADADFVPVGEGPAESPRAGFDSAPTASFTAVPGVGALDFDFDASGSMDDGLITSYDWDFGDGGVGVGQTVSHTYAEAGIYTVTLIVTDDLGKTGTASSEISVGGISEPPVASFTASQVGGTLDVELDASASSDDVGIVGYDWDFGDATTGTGMTVTHTYSGIGTFTVSLTVVDDDGLADSVSMDVTVLDPAADGPFLEAAGMVVMEAEHYTTNTDRSGHAWISSTEHAGHSGDSAMKADPDDGASFNGSAILDGPELTFDVEFVTVGLYYYWVRLYAPNTLGNSVHGGIDGAVSASKLNTETIGSWVWTNVDTKGRNRSVNVTAAGISTINLWVREDGVFADKIVLTTDASFVPVDDGPAESPRVTLAPQGSLVPSESSQIFANLSSLPSDFSLEANYPNPFEGQTTIRYALPEEGHVRLVIFDILGRRVRTLVDVSKNAGWHQVIWDGTGDSGSRVASGLFFYQMQADGFVTTRSMSLRR